MDELKDPRLESKMETTRLYLLTRRIGDAILNEVEGFVVCAESPHAARTLASAQAMDEGAAFWLDMARTTCKCIGTPVVGVERGVVLRASRPG